MLLANERHCGTLKLGSSSPSIWWTCIEGNAAPKVLADVVPGLVTPVKVSQLSKGPGAHLLSLRERMKNVFIFRENKNKQTKKAYSNLGSMLYSPYHSAPHPRVLSHWSFMELLPLLRWGSFRPDGAKHSWAGGTDTQLHHPATEEVKYKYCDFCTANETTFL